MKRAAGEIVRASLFQRQVELDDVDDIDAGKQILDKGLWNHRA
ncbi:hypothetical protein SDC9_141944 [bioreactor metagenome]|uniref:Uncharacterized protein n=1 Tax=bioreactor metagenome TaxID=1076179 RepID=A0A645DZP1_9ZZZZ